MARGSSYHLYTLSQEAWDAMYGAIFAARQSIYWEIYIFVDDAAGRPFCELLAQKAREGVDVKLLIDSFGSFGLSRKALSELRSAGVDVRFFSDRRVKKWWRRFVRRTHRKLLIVDESVGFIGGVNIKKEMAQWLDIHVRVYGPIVRSLLRSFGKSYVRTGGSLRAVRSLLRKPRKRLFGLRARSKGAEYITAVPNPNRSRIRKYYTDALSRAKKRVVLFTPYYVPDRHFIAALLRARRRGVRVDLLVPLRTDIRIATYVASSYFSLMAGMGINVRLVKRMMHGKGMLIDEKEAIVGSGNLDPGSFYDNYEGNIRIRDRAFLKKLRQTLEGWMDASQSLDDLQWHKRGIGQRMKERASLWFAKRWHPNAF